MAIPGGVTRKTWPLGEILAALLVSAQLAGIVEGRFSRESFWSWAPHDTIIQYRLRVEKDGRQLTPRETFERYGLRSGGRRYEPAEDLIAVLRIRDERERSSDMRVTATISTDGGPFRTWRWETED